MFAILDGGPGAPAVPAKEGDLRTGQIKREIPSGTRVRVVRASPDGREVVVEYQDLYLRVKVRYVRTETAGASRAALSEA